MSALDVEMDRTTGIGGSDVAAIVGISSWGSPWTVWAEKARLVEPRPETPRQAVGRLLESALGELFTAETGLHVDGEQMHLRHRRHVWARGHADGLVFDGPRRDVLQIDLALGGFEAKTDGRMGWPDGVPPYYQAQAQWYMALSRLPRWWFGVLFANFRFEVFELEADASEQRFLAYNAARFWHRHVLTGQAPPMDESQATTDMLTAIHPTHLDGLVADLSEQRATYKELRQATADRKAAEAREGRLKNELRLVIGDAETALIDGQVAATWRKSKAVDVDELLAGEPEATAPFMKFDLTEFAKRHRKIAETYKTLDGTRRLLIKEIEI